MIQRAYWGQRGEESLHKSQCNSTELCVNAILQTDYLPQYCLSNSSQNILKSLLLKLLWTISCDGLDPHLPPHSTPHPTPTNFSLYVPLGWLPLHNHVDAGRTNPFAIARTHSHHHNTAALMFNWSQVETRPSLPCGIKKRNLSEKYQHKDTYQATANGVAERGHRKEVLQIKELKDTCKTAKNKSKQDRLLATMKLLVNITERG